MRAPAAISVALIASVLALSGCSSSGGATATASADPVATTAAGPLLVVDRAGGYAGRKDHLVIRANGTGTNVDRAGQRFRLTAADTRAVRAALKASDFAHLEERYAPLGGGGSTDAYAGVLTSGGHRVEVVEGVEDLPAPLERLWLAIDKLLYPLR